MESFKKIAVLDNEIEARLLESILLERDIPHGMNSYQDEVYGSLFQMHKGWGIVNAPDSYESEIKEIISDMRKGIVDPEESL